MNIIETAANKGITINHNNGTWLANFGTEHLLETTMLSTMEKFLSACELVETKDFLCLRIDGFIHFSRKKQHEHQQVSA